jgi:F0F1-type ATP synthase membrane subunit c/vacuolar-type H+-ATPase subunit K
MAVGIKRHKKNWFSKKNWLWTCFFLLALLVGTGVRLYDLKDPPLDFHPTRQLHSAVIARGMYYQSLEDAPEWKKQLSYEHWQAEGLIEPQIMERLTAFSFQLIGSDYLWLARIWAIFFWVTGGVIIFLTAKKLSGFASGALAVVYFMVWPYTAVASRAFQPESLMIMMIAIGIWAVVNWIEKQNYAWAVAAGITCGLAIYVKSVAVFFIAPAIAGVMLSNFKLKQLLRSGQVWTIFVLSVLPYIGYHIWGVYGLGLLGTQFSFRFFPSLWTDPVFYLKWLNELKRVVGFEILIVSTVGALVFPKKKYRGLLIGFFFGYILYGFTFPYHVSTHDYYHLPFVIFSAFGLGLIFDQIVKSGEKNSRQFSRIVISLALLFFITLKAWDIRVTLKRDNYRGEVAFWENLGEEFGNEQNVIGILPDYGYRLAYWGWMDVEPWLGSEDIKLRELAGQEVNVSVNLPEKVADYDLFMVAQMDEFDKQPELKKFLRSSFVTIRDNDEIIIFDLCLTKEE